MPTIYGISITNVAQMQMNPRTYIGCTAGKLSKRLREHRCLLRAHRHTCGPLQADFDAFGDNVVIFALEHVAYEDRRVKEVEWMEKYRSLGLLYNEHIISFRPSDEAIRKGVAHAHDRPGNRWTPEVNEKRRLAQLGKPKGHGAKISATKRAKRDEIVRSASKDAGASDKEPRT
jgi:hypothetical protein